MLLLAVYGSLIPFNYQPRPRAEAFDAFRRITFHDSSDLAARGDWIVSVVMFMTISYLLMATICVDRRGCIALVAAPAVALFCAVVSVVIEFTQLYFPPRTVSINDIAVECLGGIAGTLLWTICGQRITNWVRRVTTPTDLAGLAGRVFPGYVALLFIVELMPFDLTIRTAELATKYAEGKIWLLPFHNYAAFGPAALFLKIASNMACFFPLGFLKAVASMPDKRERHGPTFQFGLVGHWPSVLLFGLAIACLVEFLQLFVYSRVCDTTDIFTGTLAVLLGWRAGKLVVATASSGQGRYQAGDVPDHRAPWGRLTVLAALFLVWIGGLLYLNWSPFDFTADPTRFPDGPDEIPVRGIRRMSWLPLVDYYWGSKYEALDQFVKKTVSFLPLGVLAALATGRGSRSWAAWTVVSIALLIAFVIEGGRYFVPSRSASVTDVLLQCLGAWLGFQFAQYVWAALQQTQTAAIGTSHYARVNQG